VHIGVENYARGFINGALNARRGLGGRGWRRGIARRSQCDRDGQVQCSEQRDPDDKTQQFHADIIGSLRGGL
jgi:hypothetical protein